MLRPKTNCCKLQKLSLQQCLSVVRHYESLKLHIQQIRPDKSVEYLRQCDPSKKKGSGQGTQSSFNVNNQNQRGHSQSRSRQGQSQTNQKTLLTPNQCYGCGQDHHQDKSECPAFGKTCHKCSRINHFVNVCGKIPYRRPFRSKSQERQQTSVNELNQNNHDNSASLMSIPNNSRGDSCNVIVPKQVLDVVNLANNGNSSGKHF